MPHNLLHFTVACEDLWVTAPLGVPLLCVPRLALGVGWDPSSSGAVEPVLSDLSLSRQLEVFTNKSAEGVTLQVRWGSGLRQQNRQLPRPEARARRHPLCAAMHPFCSYALLQSVT